MSLPALVRRVVGRSAAQVAASMLECDALYTWQGVAPPEPCRVVRRSGDRVLVEFPGRSDRVAGVRRGELVAWVNGENLVSRV